MSSTVLDEGTFLCKAFPADGTQKWAVSCVRPYMVLQYQGCRECLVTELASEWRDASVNNHRVTL